MNRIIVKPFSQDKWEVYENYSSSVVVKGGDVEVKVYKGFISDGASIPRLFWSIYPPNSPEYLTAAIIHDYLCTLANHTHKDEYNYEVWLKRLYDADDIFYYALLTLNVSKSKAKIFYYFVKMWHKIKILGLKYGFFGNYYA